MSSKSKEVRIEQRRVLEAKLALRLKKLEEKGITKEAAQRDSLIKNLKSQIRETNVRIAAFEKNAKLVQTLAQTKAEKLAAPPVKKEKKKKKPPAEVVEKQPKKHKEKHEAKQDAAAPTPVKKEAPAVQEQKETPQPVAPVQAEPQREPEPKVVVEPERKPIPQVVAEPEVQPAALVETVRIPEAVKKPVVVKEEPKEEPKEASKAKAKPAVKKTVAKEKAPPKPKAAKKVPAKTGTAAPKKTTAKKATPKPKK